MLQNSTNISYLEYRVIGKLMTAHPPSLNDSLRALIVFGTLVATGESYDINLLEVIENWQGPRHQSYGSTPALPLRGRLNLYFLSPEEFEHPTAAVLDLLKRVESAYAILREHPYEYAYRVMSQLDIFPEPDGFDAEMMPSDPLSFLQQQTLAGV